MVRHNPKIVMLKILLLNYRILLCKCLFSNLILCQESLMLVLWSSKGKKCSLNLPISAISDL
ncbi:hypothetical protein DAI22_08g253700 [Oryza sativa Japonica Group]|nr:hypothetical protein DAI22_08g253700 [Oryza sativa Japonica Group]